MPQQRHPAADAPQGEQQSQAPATPRWRRGDPHGGAAAPDQSPRALNVKDGVKIAQYRTRQHGAWMHHRHSYCHKTNTQVKRPSPLIHTLCLHATHYYAPPPFRLVGCSPHPPYYATHHTTNLPANQSAHSLVLPVAPPTLSTPQLDRLPQDGGRSVRPGAPRALKPLSHEARHLRAHVAQDVVIVRRRGPTGMARDARVASGAKFFFQCSQQLR